MSDDEKSGRPVSAPELEVLARCLLDIAARDGSSADATAWSVDPVAAVGFDDLEDPARRILRRMLLCDLASGFDDRAWDRLSVAELGEYDRCRREGDGESIALLLARTWPDVSGVIEGGLRAIADRYREHRDQLAPGLAAVADLDDAIWEKGEELRAARRSAGIKVHDGDSRRINLDRATLAAAGLGSLSEKDASGLLRAAYEAMELRVGTLLSDGLSNDQLAEFERLIDLDDAFAHLSDAWLQIHRPDYRDVTHRVFAEVCEELASSAQAILDEVERWPA